MNRVSILDKTPKTARGKRTREKLLRAAEIEFGEKGFHEAAVSGIT
jgi:AcrR family transcriptional regulator